MEKKRIQIAFIALFLLLCLLPSVGMLLLGESQGLANEAMAPRAALRTAEGKLNCNVLSDFSSWFEGRIAFRKELVSAWASLNARVFRTSVEEQVVLGKDGWLYYSPTVDDYMGRGMSEEELERAAQNLAAIQRGCESRGARFLFTIAPNKNSLYGDNMPDRIAEDHAASNAERLKPVLERYGVNYVDLFAAFSDRGELLYYRTDSHWDNRGAALAADTILAALGTDAHFFDGPFAAGEPHLGDLYEMIYPAGTEREEGWLYSPGFTYSVSGNPRGGEAQKIKTSRDNESGSLLCWRDSFGNALYPYLAERFGEAQFLRSASYDLSQLDASGADTVIVELVERNLAQLADLDPQLFAEAK